MPGFSELDSIPSWFVVLPDCPSAVGTDNTLRDRAELTVHHPSGRPWLMGRWGEQHMACGQAGANKLAVLGEFDVTTGRLAEAAAHVRTVADVDALARRLAGSFHLIASVDGRVRAQGSVTGFRRLFRADIDGITVASDRADVLALLGRTGLDEQRLALHLLDPPVLHPLTYRPVWRDVGFVAPDSYLVLDTDGRSHQVQWWFPPEPELPLAEGAAALRQALTAAVGVRTGGRELVSSDLSGLDSTSLCCLAARDGPKVIACTAASPDPLDDDVQWAQLTAAAIGRIEHHIIPADEMPLIYHGLLDMNEPLDELLDEPCGGIADYARWLTIAGRAAGHGSRLHLTGFGGDETLGCATSHLRTLLRHRPVTALLQLRGFAAKYGWPRGQMLRQLCDGTSYGRWLNGAADRLTTPPPPDTAPALDWGPTPRLAPWVTPDAADAVRELIRTEAATARPLGPRGLHDDLVGIRDSARPVRQISRLAARIGLTLSAPYYDDRVLEAALAVRREEKRPPWGYKPLIQEAMRGIVPARILGRQAKSGGTCDLDAALRHNRAELLALFEDSRLGRTGLIDAAALRKLCTGPLRPHPYDLHDALYQAVACEIWLRTWERAATHPKAGAML
ncbi:asparagine synthase-related protein [Streptomyces sp. ISL-100]|uniref:asparagine synthase-related protein n=1 Tax=Streptomyces sp. ISL-100 TaxID=2819173 RepID=UPI001BE90BCF|nr:asparagine synthase-related protein [Streptomyces sp. ISL-100]MBT2399095.1 asparagine synthase [Streptomyces sp. ISL-100]